MRNEWFWHSEWVEHSAIAPGKNRSFLFGDGFFETMRWSASGSCLLWTFHWDRIVRTQKALCFSWPESLTESVVESLIREKIPDQGSSEWRVKILFFRVGDGKYTAERPSVAFFLQVETCETPLIRSIRHVKVSQSVTISKHPFSWIKSCSSLPYVMAGIERADLKADELILTNANGEVIEGSYSFIFWSKKGDLFVADPELGGIDSCMRRFLIHYWQSQKIPFEYVRVPLQELEQADWIGFGNGIGLMLYSQKNLPTPELFPESWKKGL